VGITEDLTDALAKDALEAAKKAGDQKIVDDVAEVLNSTSTTAYEAYMTAVRVRRAVTRAHETLAAFKTKNE